MASTARKLVLPKFTLTQVGEGLEADSTRVSLATEGGPFTYYTVPIVDSETGSRRDGNPRWVAGTYRLFPVVLCGDGSPWAEANLWLLDMLELKTMPNMLTFASIADDLAAYRRYIEDEDISWLDFVAHRLRRPTYRYHAALRLAVQAREISLGVAKRRMATVVRFYRWMISEKIFNPAHTPWNESDRYVEWKNEQGFSQALKVKTTDVAIKTRSADDPWDDRIVDGGRLRPLPQLEQEALLLTLSNLGNTEMALIHLFSLLSGARIQTVLTVRVRQVSRNPDEIVGRDFRLNAGPGTAIDTKNGKKGVLHLPKWFYERLYIYMKSERARARRLKADGGDHDDQFLFLSYRGAALYEPHDQRNQTAGEGPLMRHAKTGQAVRQFIKEQLLPGMRKQLGNPQYEFSFHDLRATFGMNTVDHLLKRIGEGSMTYTRALDQLRQLMWHTRLSTTENYLNYRDNLFMIQSVEEGWHSHLTDLAKNALKSGVAVDAQN